MKRLFTLSPRLRTAAELVPRGSALTDVGTDHGRLPVWLLQNGVIERAVATDLREKPLARARELAERWGVADQIAFRLCDGLSQVSSEEARTLTITGMGGETIAGILQAAPWIREDNHRHMILQPMSGADGLRRYLSGDGFVIEREVLVREEETLYVILLARPGITTPYTEGEIWAGRQTPELDSPLRSLYLKQEVGKLDWAIQGLAKSRRPEEQKKRNYFERVALEVARMQKEWDAWQP